MSNKPYPDWQSDYWWLPALQATALDYPQTIAESPVLADIVDREIGA